MPAPHVLALRYDTAGSGGEFLPQVRRRLSVYPAIPLLAGLVMLGERLGRRQLLGVTLITAGLILIGLG